MFDLEEKRLQRSLTGELPPAVYEPESGPERHTAPPRNLVAKGAAELDGQPPIAEGDAFDPFETSRSAVRTLAGFCRRRAEAARLLKRNPSPRLSAA